MDFVTIDQSEPVSQLIGRCAEKGMFQACIVDGQQLVGVFDPRALLKARVDVAEMKCAKVAKAVPRLTSTDDHETIAAHMYDADTHLLPIVRDDKLVGGMHILQLLGQIRNQLDDLKVEQLRHPQPLTIHELDRTDTALSIMHDEGIDRLPVVDNAQNVIGFLSYQDILTNYYMHHIERDNGQAPKSRTRAFRAELPDLAGLPVRNLMRIGDIQQIDENDSVGTAIDRMIEHRMLSLLIMEDGKAKGMIIAKDLLQAFLHKKTPADESIQYVGVEELHIDSFLKHQVKRIASHHASRLVRYFNNEHQFTLHIKEYSKSGSRHKFSVNLRVTYPGATVPVTEAHAWNIRTAVQEAFGRLEQNLSNMYKGKREVSERHTAREIPEPGRRPAQSI